ncbi:hypothetical protein RRG08_029127 [Elysia crispata]|uniref:Uncharacterized protein n=1 Tax=Elysia crispata TaxID=231223 RepID=A0AAE0Y6S4_9GAST|nr:hypothetical protein RRG08_029127 [Elysia crispata]
MVAHRAAYMVRQREAQINKAKFESFPTVLNRRHPQQQCGVWGWEVYTQWMNQSIDNECPPDGAASTTPWRCM